MKREVIAKNYTPIYDEIEDRIRVSINYDDLENRVDFMVTRRFYIEMINSIDDFIFTKFNEQLESFNKPVKNIEFDRAQAPIKNQDNSADNIESNNDRYATNMDNMKLYKTDDELLLELKLNYNQAAEKITIIFSSNNSTSTSTMDRALFINLFNVIKKSAPVVRWGIGF